MANTTRPMDLMQAHHNVMMITARSLMNQGPVGRMALAHTISEIEKMAKVVERPKAVDTGAAKAARLQCDNFRTVGDAAADVLSRAASAMGNRNGGDVVRPFIRPATKGG